MAEATTAAQLETTAAAGYAGESSTNAFTAVQNPATFRGIGPGGVEAPSKFDKAVISNAVTKPEVTSVNPPPYSTAELNHRFTGVAPAGFVEPIFPHPQV